MVVLGRLVVANESWLHSSVGGYMVDILEVVDLGMVGGIAQCLLSCWVFRGCSGSWWLTGSLKMISVSEMYYYVNFYCTVQPSLRIVKL